MARDLSPELAALLGTADPASQDHAWSEFLKRYNTYLVKTTRFLSHDYDGAMDRYRYVLEELRRDNFKRLRAYAADPRSRLSTWLVAVVQRLCVDYERKRYGRLRETSSGATREALTARRRLLDLVTEELDAFSSPPRGWPPARRSNPPRRRSSRSGPPRPKAAER